MPSDKQIAANRANAAHSTGPRSIAGKAVSSMNAVTSGVYAESEIVKGENPDALNDLADRFYEDFQPANAMEAALLDNVIRDTWLLIRFARIDVEILDYKVQEALFNKPDTQTGRAFLDSSADQIRLQRRIDQTRRSQIQSFKEFQRLQAERRAQPQPEPLDVTAVPSTPPEQIGFVSSTPPPAPETTPEPQPLATGHQPPAILPDNRGVRYPAVVVPEPDTALPWAPLFSKT